MNKNILAQFDKTHPYLNTETASTKIILKNIPSLHKRVRTEAFEHLSQNKYSLDKINSQTLASRDYVLEKPKKKAVVSSSISENKNLTQSSSNLNIQILPLSHRKNPTLDLKRFEDNSKTNILYKLGLKQKQMNKTHIRQKTECCEQNIHQRISQIYSKLKNISSVKYKSLPKDQQKNYKVEQTAGKGTFGVVYKATSLITGEQVVIKKVAQDKKYKNRELQIMKMLNHINIVKMKDHYYTQTGSTQYLNIVMEFYQQNLYSYNHSFLKRAQFMPAVLLKIYIFQMFKALNYLSVFSIAHRDIKPHNILINTRNHKLVICDFGSAKQLIPSQSNIAYICSRCYRAPELIFGSTQYTSQIDMWSIGCIIIQMINGDPPFIANSQLEHLIEIIKVLGTPSKQTIFEMNKNYNMNNYKYPLVNPKDWKKVLKYGTDTLLVDLVKKIMRYSPLHRLTPFEAMCHPYFDELRNQDQYQTIIAKTGCYDLLKFNPQQLSQNSQFEKKIIPSWFSK